MLEQTSNNSLCLAAYHELVLVDCMDGGRRRGTLCCWAAVQYHMAAMMRWHHLPSLAAACQALTQPMAAVDSDSSYVRYM